MWDFEWIRLGCEVDLERFADSSFFHAAFADPTMLWPSRMVTSWRTSFTGPFPGVSTLSFLLHEQLFMLPKLHPSQISPKDYHNLWMLQLPRNLKALVRKATSPSWTLASPLSRPPAPAPILWRSTVTCSSEVGKKGGAQLLYMNEIGIELSGLGLFSNSIRKSN